MISSFSSKWTKKLIIFCLILGKSWTQSKAVYCNHVTGCPLLRFKWQWESHKYINHAQFLEFKSYANCLTTVHSNTRGGPTADESGWETALKETNYSDKIWIPIHKSVEAKYAINSKNHKKRCMTVVIKNLQIQITILIEESSISW